MSERLSVCCGAPEHPDVEDMCGQCREWSGFEEDDDGRTVEDRAGGAGGGPALRGAASTAAMADAARGVEQEGDTVAKAMARIRGKLDAAFPLLTEYLERAHAASDLEMDEEKDEGDGGLGSGRWMDKP